MVRGLLAPLRLVVAWVVLAAAVPGTAQAASGDDPAVGTGVASPAPRAERTSTATGLDHRMLPLESRTSLLDYVARNVPGALLGGDGTLRLRGGEARDNVVLADGFRLRRPSLPIGLVARSTVLTAGYGADLGDVPGGALVIDLRSGTNALEAEADVFHDLRDPTASVVAATIAGPVVRDRLFVLASLLGTDSQADALIDPRGPLRPQPGPAVRDLLGALKVTWLASRAHRFESLTLIDRGRSENGDGLAVAPEAQLTRTDRGLFTSLRWTGDFGALRARSQLAFDRGQSELQPRLCRDDPVACEAAAPVVQLFPTARVSMNGTLQEDRADQTWQLVNSLDLRLGTGSPIEQRLRLSSRVSGQAFSWSRSTPTNKVITLQGPTPDAETEIYANDPRLAPAQHGPASFAGSALHTFHALEDEVRLGQRLWLFPGVGLAASRAATDAGHTFRDAAITQHLGLAWDVGGDGRTWLRASAHRRVQPELESAARFALGTPVQRRCAWSAVTLTYSHDCTFSGGPAGRSFGLPCGPLGLSGGGDPCRETVGLPRTWEQTLGVRRVLPSDLELNLDLVYRRTTGLPVASETNRIWTGSSQPEPTGAFENGRPAPVTNWTTAAENQRRYLGATISLSRSAGAFRGLAAYTLSRLRTALPPELAAAISNGDGSALPLDLDDRPHGIRLLATYDLLGHLSLGVIYAHDSGAPLPMYRSALGWDELRQRLGVPTGRAETSDQRGPGIERLNLQARWRLQPLLRANLDVYLDAMSLRGEALVTDESSPTFGARLRDPRWYRLGAEYRY